MKGKTVVSNAVWIPIKTVDKQLVQKNYTHSFYEERACSKCEYLDDRHSDICDSCPAFLGRVKTYKTKRISGQPYVGIPIGDKRNIIKKTGVAPHQVKDKNMVLDFRPRCKMSRPILFTGQLKSYQITPVEDIVSIGYGILRAPPRSGKTVMAVACVCRLGLRTLILTNQHDLLEQFLDTFDKFTDHADHIDRKVTVGIARTVQDMLKYDVVLCTYQKFLSSMGRKNLRKIRKHFGTLIVDEAHRSSALEFSRVINYLVVKHKIGLTATPERKDGRHVVMFDLLGPVTANSERKTLIPKVMVHAIKREPKYGTCKTWNGAMSWIATDKKRNAKIVKHVLKLVKVGHHVIIPVVRVGHCQSLVQSLNKEAGRTIAQEFTGKSKNRKNILAKAQSGKIKVTVGIRSIIATGVNVPRWSAIVEVVPISNEPNHYQEVMRVATEMEGKLSPEVHHFISGWGGEFGCLRTCIKVYNKFCFVDKENRKKLYDLLDRSRRGNSFSGIESNSRFTSSSRSVREMEEVNEEELDKKYKPFRR